MSASVWKKTTFGNIGTLAMCKRVFQYETKQEGEIPFYKIGTFGSEPDAYISQELFDEYKKQFSYPNKGDILISASGTIGRTVIFDGKPSYFQDSNIMWLAHNESKIINEYLFHLYKTITWNLEGSTIKRLYTDNFKKIEVLFPQDINEQKRISDILSTCDAVIQNTQKTIEKYKAIKQGMMQDLFTRGLTKDGKLRPSYEETPKLYKQSELGMIPKEWEVGKLEDYVIDISDGPFGSNLKAIHYTDRKEVRIIQLGNIGEDGWLDENVKYTTFSHAKEISRCVVTPGEVVVAKMMPAGRTIICPNNEKGYVLSSDGIRILFDNKILNKIYFRFFTKTNYFLDQINKDIQGSTRARTSILKLKAMNILQPKIEEQNAIADRLSSIDSTIQKEEAILAKYKNIKTGLMARLLTPPEDAQIIDETEE